jgi:hypothetical protein
MRRKGNDVPLLKYENRVLAELARRPAPPLTPRRAVEPALTGVAGVAGMLAAGDQFAGPLLGKASPPAVPRAQPVPRATPKRPALAPLIEVTVGVVVLPFLLLLPLASLRAL